MDITIRPSTKTIQAVYWLVVALVLAVVIHGILRGRPHHLMFLVPAVVLAANLIRHAGRAFIRLTVTADMLRYEAGIFSKSTRTVEIAKVQDVRVDQSLGQRIIGVGNLSVETAGGSSRLTVANIDQPQAAADKILALAAGRK